MKRCPSSAPARARSSRAWIPGIFLLGLGVSAPATAGPVTSTSNFSFETLQQSMWGPNGPSVVDTGVLFVGPQWNTTVPGPHAELPFGLTISTSAIPKVVRDFLDIPNSVTLGSTSKTSIDVTASTSGKIGFDFRAILDPGSVDASYSGRATLSAIDVGPGSAGTRRLTLLSGELNPAAALATRSPQIDIESNFIAQMTAAVGLDGKWVTRPALGEFPSGCPFTVTIVVDVGVPCAFGGQTEQAINLDPRVHKASLIDVDEKKQLLKFTNTELTVLGLNLVDAAPDSGQIEVELDIAVDVLELALLAAGGAGGVPIDVTATDNSNPKKPRKGKDVDPTDIVDVKVSLGDLTLYVPLLNTESHTIVEKTKAVHTSGQTNLARIDLDADLMAGVLFPGVVPILGAKAGIGIGPLTFISLEADLLDADIGELFLGGQDFSFKPELWQTLDFGEEVSFSLGNGIWQTSDTIMTKVGTPIQIEIDPFKDLSIAPTYTLANEFSNLTRLLGQPVFEVEILRLDLDLIAPLPDPNALVAKNFSVPLGAPQPLVTLFDEKFALAGFRPVGGEAFVIQALQVGDVPEPGSLALLALGLTLLAARRLRQRDRAARRRAFRPL